MFDFTHGLGGKQGGLQLRCHLLQIFYHLDNTADLLFNVPLIMKVEEKGFICEVFFQHNTVDDKV